MDNMVWNVYYHNINKDKIEIKNIFSHGDFSKGVKDLLWICKTKNRFEDNLKRELCYYFWCRAEYEIVIGPWVGGRTDGIKIDIYEQVMLNWEIFVDYVWSFKEAANKE